MCVCLVIILTVTVDSHSCFLLGEVEPGLWQKTQNWASDIIVMLQCLFVWWELSSPPCAHQKQGRMNKRRRGREKRKVPWFSRVWVSQMASAAPSVKGDIVSLQHVFQNTSPIFHWLDWHRPAPRCMLLVERMLLCRDAMFWEQHTGVFRRISLRMAY